MVRAIFQSRRKVITNSLKSMGKTSEQVLSALNKTGIDPQIRGEKLGIEKMMELSTALETEATL
jgi:16S rRNA A1518/A1519 N6-dimethyltransferase RsmA/KsgA/DIM1 with predicted DNA glycosylase/AP lyase activity